MKTSSRCAITGTAVFAAVGFLLAADKLQQSQKSQTSPASQPSTQPATQASAPPLYAGDGPNDWSNYQALHAFILDRFIRSKGFGMERMVQVEDIPRSKTIYADGTHYSIGRVQLISLNDGDQPFAYVTWGDVMKNQISKAKHVSLDKTESAALDEIKQGKEVVLTGAGDGREFLGAIRATSTCIKCHEVAENTLLGAFRYPLLAMKEIPADARP